MSESIDLGWLRSVLDILKTYSRGLRLIVLLIVLPVFLIFGHEAYHWPGGWPTHSVSLNLLMAAVLIVIICLLVLTNPEETPSLDKLPDVKPVMDQSLKYFKMERELGKGRKDLIREFENKIRRRELQLSQKDLATCAAGPWEFDRIVHHLSIRYQSQLTSKQRMVIVRTEKEILDTKHWKESLAPMHYAIEAVFDLSSGDQPPILDEPDLDLIAEIERKLNSLTTLLRRWFRQDIRGDAIIKNCKTILRRNPR